MSAPAPTWHQQAACRDVDRDVFYPKVKRGEGARGHDPYADARAICERCPVRDACLDDALEWETDRGHGMRGALTPGERNRLRRRRGAA